MQDTNNSDVRVETLKSIQDPDEFITAFREMFAEGNGMAAGDMFPITDEEAGDIILSSLGLWMALRVTPPVKTREQVVAMMSDMARVLDEMSRKVPEEPEHLKGFAMHCLRWGVAPYCKQSLG